MNFFRKKGITLIELITAIAITSILIAIVFNALILNLKFFDKSSFENDAQLSAYDIYQNVNTILTREGNKEVQILTAPIPTANYQTNHTYIYPENNFLMYAETNKTDQTTSTNVQIELESRVSPEGGENYTINFNSISDNPFVINVVITISDNRYGDFVYENIVILRKNAEVIFPESVTAQNGSVIVIEDVVPKVVVE